MLVTVVRVELDRAQYERLQAKAGVASFGTVVSESLLTMLPSLVAMKPKLAQGSQPGIELQSEQPATLAALRRIAEHTPPPRRFTATVRLAVPSELWREIERERARLGLSVDELIAWALRRR